jgi:hypothetical protein
MGGHDELRGGKKGEKENFEDLFEDSLDWLNFNNILIDDCHSPSSLE